MIKKNDMKFEKIKVDISYYTKRADEFISSFHRIVDQHHLNDSSTFNEIFENYRFIDFLYNESTEPIQSRTVVKNDSPNRPNNENTENVTPTEFYDGFEPLNNPS